MDEVEDQLCALVPELFDSMTSPRRLEHAPELAHNAGWLLTFMLQTPKGTSAVLAHSACQERLFRITEDGNAESDLRGALASVFVSVAGAESPTPVAQARDLIERLPTTSALHYRLFSSAPYGVLLASSNILIKTVGLWFAAAVSHSGTLRNGLSSMPLLTPAQRKAVVE